MRESYLLALGREVWHLYYLAEFDEPLRRLLPLACAVEAVDVRMGVVLRVLWVRFQPRVEVDRPRSSTVELHEAAPRRQVSEREGGCSR
jgi:hypothetical protein